jgi:transposase
VEERQVFDIPAMKIVIVAHQATIKVCPECQTENKGDFPENVTQPVQYGDGVKTVASYFNNEHFVPVARTAQIFKDLWGQAPSEATILKASKQLNQHIQPAREAVKERLRQEPLLNVDETGLRVEGLRSGYVHDPDILSRKNWLFDSVLLSQVNVRFDRSE